MADSCDGNARQEESARAIGVAQVNEEGKGIEYIHVNTWWSVFVCGAVGNSVS